MTGNLTAADHFRAVASGYCERADRTAKLVLRGVYRQLAVEYMAIAMQQEAIDRLEALIVRLGADEITARDHAFGRSAEGGSRDCDASPIERVRSARDITDKVAKIDRQRD